LKIQFFKVEFKGKIEFKASHLVNLNQSTNMTSKESEVKEYYGKTITHQNDLKTTACCTTEKPPQHILNALNKLHPEVRNTYYGCGLIAPDELKGLTILDLGSGSGHDVYLLSQLVGENGKVIGVDMTEEQLTIARKYQEFHQENFGHGSSNVVFHQGYIENLSMILDQTIDVVVSNCVVNLSNKKEEVFKEVYRVLKPGGEFYFSDVYSSKRIPQFLQQNSTLWGECLSGALYWNDFLNLVKKVGFHDPRLVKDKLIEPRNADLEHILGSIKFYSATYRLFKLDELELDCENYGQTVTYLGTIENYPDQWVLDTHHLFPVNQPIPVCRNTFLILKKSRFKYRFVFQSPQPLEHLGIFPECGKDIPFSSSDGASRCC